MTKQNLKVEIISNEGQTINELICCHIDAVKSHTVFYSNTTRPKPIRIFDTIESVMIGDKIIRLFYKNYYAEITRS